MLNMASSEFLRQKLSALQESCESQYYHNLNRETLSTPNLRSMIRRLLWRISQKGLYNPEASRKLSPINFAGIMECDYPMLDGDSSIDSSGGSNQIERDHYDFPADNDNSSSTLLEDGYCSIDLENDIDGSDSFDEILENSNSDNDLESKEEENDSPDSSTILEQSENITSVPLSGVSTTPAFSFSSSPLTLNDDLPCPSVGSEPDAGLLFSDPPELETPPARAFTATFHDSNVGKSTDNGDSDEEMLYD